MAVITWQNVPGADLGSALGGIRSAADLFNRGGDSAQEAVKSIGDTNATVEAIKRAAVEKQLTQQMLAAPNSVEYQKIIEGGLARGQLPDGTRLDPNYISPEMLVKMDTRFDDLNKREEMRYKQQMEEYDNQFASEAVRAAHNAQDPATGYGQKLLEPEHAGTLKGTLEAIKAIKDAHIDVAKGGNPSSKLLDLEATARGWKIFNEMRSAGGGDGSIQRYNTSSNDPLAQSKAYEFATKFMPGWAEKNLSPVTAPPAAPAGAPQHHDQQQPGAGAGGPARVDSMLSSGIAAAPTFGGPSTFGDDGMGKRFGSVVARVRESDPTAPPPPGYTWDGVPTGQTPTYGEIVDWNQKYAKPVSQANGWGVDEKGQVRGTTATGPYQINDDTRQEFAKKIWKDNWRYVPQTPENEDRLAEAIFKEQGWKAWEALKKFNPEVFKGKSFKDLAPMIRQLDGGVPPLSYGKEIGILQNDLKAGVQNLNSTDMIALKARHPEVAQAIDPTFRPGPKGDASGDERFPDGQDAVGIVSSELKNVGVAPNAGSIKEYLRWMDDKIKAHNEENPKAKINLSEHEKARILLDSYQEDGWTTFEDIGKGIDVIDKRVMSTIKDFGKSQLQADKLADLYKSVSNLSNLSNQYSQASQALAKARDFANPKTNPDPEAQKLLPAKFAALAKISDEIGKHVKKPVQVDPEELAKHIKTIAEIEREAATKPPVNQVEYAQQNPQAFESFLKATGLNREQGMALLRQQAQAPAVPAAAKVDQLLASSGTSGDLPITDLRKLREDIRQAANK